MKLKKEYIILGAVIVLLAVYLAFRETDRIHYQLPVIAGLKSSDITKIEITKEGKPVSVIRKENRWVMEPEGFTADPQKIGDMLQAMEQFTLSARISESMNYERYELGDDKKIHIKIYAANDLRRVLDIGSAASTFRHTHVRVGDDPVVYQVQGNLKTKFDVTADGLRDKTVLSFDTRDVTELSVRKEKKTVLFRKKEGDQASKEKSDPVWETADGKPADIEKVRRILLTLSTLKCQEFIKDAKKEDYKNPTLEISVKGKKESRLLIFENKDKGAKNKPGVSSESDYPFLLADYVISDFMLE